MGLSIQVRDLVLALPQGMGSGGDLLILEIVKHTVSENEPLRASVTVRATMVVPLEPELQVCEVQIDFTQDITTRNITMRTRHPISVAGLEDRVTDYIDTLNVKSSCIARFSCGFYGTTAMMFADWTLPGEINASVDLAVVAEVVGTSLVKIVAEGLREMGAINKMTSAGLH